MNKPLDTRAQKNESDVGICENNSSKSERLTLYEQLAEELKEQIRQGIFNAGDRLPSERALAALKHVSVNTVQESYRQLEDEQWIVIKSQSGAYVAPTLPKTTDRESIVRKAGAQPDHLSVHGLQYRSDLSPFGAAVPHSSFLPCDRLSAAMSNVLRKRPGTIGSINLAPGSLELRQQIARRGVEWGANIDPRRIVITNGGCEAIQLCLRAVTRPGDTVAVETPAYYGFLHAIQSLGLRVLEVPSSGAEGIDLEFLDRIASLQDIAAILLSTTVSNPSGATMPMKKKRRLVEIAVRHHIPVIEDATMADLHYEGECQAAQGFDSSGLVMLCASLTKTIAPSMRMGWIDGAKFSERLVELKRSTSVGQPQVLELTLTDYLASGGVTKRLRSIRKAMQSQAVQVAENVLKHFPEGTSVALPTGGYLLWIELPPMVESLELQKKAVDIGIGIAPGVLFSPGIAYRNFIRLNCGAQGDRSTEAVIALSRIVEDLDRK